MNAPWKYSRDNESGQAIIEFAVIMFPLLLLFLIALDGGSFFYGYLAAAHGVREGARCGVVGGSDANIIALVESNFGTPAPSVSVQRTDENGDGTVGIGDRITVTATWVYTWASPVSSVGLSPTTTKTYTTKMRLESAEADRTCS